MKRIYNDIEKQRLIFAIKFLKENKFAKSISQICEICGVNPGYLRDIEAKNTNFSQVFLEKLFATYPINEDYILTGNGEILLGENGSNMAGDVNANNSGSGVQNVQTNCGHVENNTHTGGGTGGEVLQQLIATNAKMVETLAQMVDNNNKLMETNSRLMENNSKLMETLSKLSEG